jgi:GTP cyclohydrolase FolE2
MGESFWENEDIIGEVVKNKKEKYVVKRVSNKDKFYRDVRVYYWDGEEYKPSSKGIVIAEENLESIIQLLGFVDIV